MSREYLPGQIIAYPYLWAWQQDRGETEGQEEVEGIAAREKYRQARDEYDHRHDVGLLNPRDGADGARPDA